MLELNKLLINRLVCVFKEGMPNVNEWRICANFKKLFLATDMISNRHIYHRCHMYLHKQIHTQTHIGLWHRVATSLPLDLLQTGYMMKTVAPYPINAGSIGSSQRATTTRTTYLWQWTRPLKVSISTTWLSCLQLTRSL